MGEQFENRGLRRGEADFDDAVGHRLDRLDLGEIVAQDMSAARRQIGAQDRGDAFGRHLAAVAPFRLVDAEDITEPVAGHRPALGEADVDLPLSIIADQPLRGRIEQCGIGGRQFAVRRIGGGIERPDRRDADRPALAEQAATGKQKGQKPGRDEPRAVAASLHDLPLLAGADGGTRTRTPRWIADFKSM